MKLFIRDMPVSIVSKDYFNPDQHFDMVVDIQKEGLPYEYLIDNILVRNADAEVIINFYRKFRDKKNKKIHTVTFLTNNYESTIFQFKSFFKVIKAAGGVVRNKSSDILLIYRLENWDLPKGKLEKGEGVPEGALREVEEECNIKVEIEDKLCKTWHTYSRNGKHYLKKTSWFVMNCIDDSNMRPQTEEDIVEVKWVNFTDLRRYLFDSYRSIRTVMRNYREYLEVQAAGNIKKKQKKAV